MNDTPRSSSLRIAKLWVAGAATKSKDLQIAQALIDSERDLAEANTRLRSCEIAKTLADNQAMGLRHANEASRPSVGAPVAWRHSTPNGWVVTKTKHMDSEPLYTIPLEPVSASDAQMRRLLIAARITIKQNRHLCEATLLKLFNAVQDIDAAMPLPSAPRGNVW